MKHNIFPTDLEKLEINMAKELGVPSSQVCIVGSTLICGQGNDTDFLCLVPSEDVLQERGFSPDLEIAYESPLRSYRRDNANVIATTDPGFFLAEVAIAHAARLVNIDKFDMKNRDDRVRFHGFVRDQVMARMGELEVF